MNINNEIINVIHQIIICFNLFEKESVLLINQRINHIIVITPHTARINSHNSFVINANVNKGWIIHINQSTIIQTQIRVVVLRQNQIIIKTKIIASIAAVIFAVIAKENNNAETIRYLTLWDPSIWVPLLLK